MEPLGESHRDGLRAAGADERIWEWVDARVPVEDRAFDHWFDARREETEAGDGFTYATIDRGSGALIGSSSLISPRPADDGVEIGWTWLTPGAWRTGANREAKRLMLELCFERLGAMRVEFKTDSRNQRSREALAAIGASFEGIFRKHRHQPLRGIRDSAYFSITDEDWPHVSANLDLAVASKAPS